MIDLSDVTLWACVWSKSEPLIDRTFRAVRFCTTVARFGEVIFFCCDNPRIGRECGWRTVSIPALDMKGWNLFINREIPKHFKTLYALSVHEDGFILDASLWSHEFRRYDYIGAPWPGGLVGNQGFCLESQRMMRAKMALPRQVGDEDIPSDRFICDKHRSRLERGGIVFAPADVALRFSTEMYGDDRPSFGFHGRSQSHRKYPTGWKMIEESESKQ